jgi:hypothetical protein
MNINNTNGVFIDLIGSDTNVPSYDVFLNIGNTTTNNKNLNKFTNEYKEMVTKNKSTIVRMAKLEEIIMQIRSIDDMSEIKLSMVRNYIYARAPFYRMGKVSKDIRIIVDKVDFWSTDLKRLRENEIFMNKAKSKLIDTMTEEVRSNMEEYELTK